MARVSEVIRGWLGWCPNARTMNTGTVILPTHEVTPEQIQPGGGTGRPGRIDRGFSLFFGSIRILIKNRQLFWFSFLTGLVLLFSLMTTIALQLFSGTDPLTGGSLVAGSAILIEKGSFAWLALTFAAQLIGVFCVFFLMTGLVTCVSRLFSGRAATVREGLSTAGTHVGSITGWAVVFAILGTVQSVFLDLHTGNFSLVIISGIIIVLLYLVTIFVIPIFVFEERNLIGAIAGSLSLFRKTWGEILLCCFLFGLFFFAVAFVSILPLAGIGFPSGNPLFLGITVALFEFVSLIAIIIGTTMIGILLMGLYTFAKTDRIPDAFLKEKRIDS